MLLLLFRVAGEVYAVEAGRVVRVVPRVELRTLPHAPGPLAGLFRYRGRMVPVIDLGILLGAGPSPSRLSTRIILVADPTRAQSRARGEAAAGLIAEHVSEVGRVDDVAVLPPPAVLGESPYFGAIVSSEAGLVPLFSVEKLLAGPLRHGPIAAEAPP